MGKVIPMPIGKDAGVNAPPLVGTPANPARDPSDTAKGDTGKKSIGNIALTDSLILIAIAWALLFMLWYSVRNHNI